MIGKILEKIVIYDNIRSQWKQIKFFINRKKYVISKDDLDERDRKLVDKVLAALKNNIFIPKIDKAKFLALFYDIRKLPVKIYNDDFVIDLHFVWDNEYFRLSKTIDEKYREVRKKIFGRVGDVESIVIFPKSNFIRYLYNNQSFGTYDLPLHIKAVEFIYIPAIFVNSWNHMLSERFSLHITKRLGGYYRAKDFIIKEGTRCDAEEFVKEKIQS